MMSGHFLWGNVPFQRIPNPPREPTMSTMNREVYDALIDAGADETKAREAAISVAQFDRDIAEIKASLLVLKWMVGFVLAFVVALVWRNFA